MKWQVVFGCQLFLFRPYPPGAPETSWCFSQLAFSLERDQGTEGTAGRTFLILRAFLLPTSDASSALGLLQLETDKVYTRAGNKNVACCVQHVGSNPAP